MDVMKPEDGSTNWVFPMKRVCPFSPPPQYTALREQKPISKVMLPSGKPAWLLTRHADVKAILADPRVSSDPMRPGFPEQKGAGREDPSEKRRAPLLIEMDPPEHSTYRRMLIGEFAVARVNEMRPRIQQIVDELIDEIVRKGPVADLVESFALPIPTLVICGLLGVPYADHEFFQARTREVVSLSASPEQAEAAFNELGRYVDELVARKEGNPPDDLIGRLIVDQCRRGTLTHEQLVSMAMLLLVAGHESSASMIALGIATFLHNPDQLAKLRAAPELAVNAVEEMMRFHSLGDADAVRVAVEDIEIAGEWIKAGDGIIPLLPAANRDPEAFERPDSLDIQRQGRHHLGFGYGIHQCLGQNLARAELEIAYRTLFERIPTLRLAVPVEGLPFKYDSTIFGLHALPVLW